MSDVLAKICADKRAETARRKALRSLAAIEAAAREAPPPRGFANRLAAATAEGRYGLIAEIKRASPSKGLIRADFDPATLARAYARGGATCLSVLTDESYFEGKDEYLTMAHDAVVLPALRKDFTLEPYQVVEARALGADCILIIMAALDDAAARELADAAAFWNMDALIEVHDRAELDRAIKLIPASSGRLIGINNRNLKTLAVDLATTEILAPRVPQDRIVVCESGLKTPEDLARMACVGVHCFLVGESLMAQADVEAATRTLLAQPKAAVFRRARS